MSKKVLHLLAVGFLLMTQAAFAQSVKLANIALGMDEAEVKAALAPTAPFYINQPSDSTDMHYLVAESEMESYAFLFIEGKVVAFSVVHILPPGQLPFLPPGQQPTVSILRDLITKQTWAPAEIKKGDTWWFSAAFGEPLSDAKQCAPESGAAWLPFGTVPGAKLDARPPLSTEALMKPSLTLYPSKCGASIHLNQSPAESEDSVVTSVRYQVLDIRAMNAFLARHRQK